MILITGYILKFIWSLSIPVMSEKNYCINDGEQKETKQKCNQKYSQTEQIMLKKYVAKAETRQKPTRKILEPYLKLQVQMGETRTISMVILMHLL